MITIVTVKENDGVFEVREDRRNIAIGTDDDQFVLEGIAKPDAEIIDYASEYLPAPCDGLGDYEGWEVRRDSSCVEFRIVLSDGHMISFIVSDTADFSPISEEEANVRYQSGNWPFNAWCVSPEIAQRIDEIDDPESVENFKVLDKNAIWTGYYESH